MLLGLGFSESGKLEFKTVPFTAKIKQKPLSEGSLMKMHETYQESCLLFKLLINNSDKIKLLSLPQY